MKRSNSYGAAAGKPFKRAKSTSKKALVGASRSKVYKSVDLYSPTLPHYFKRCLQDGVMYTNGALSVAVKDASGAVPTWLSLGTLAADQGGVSNTAQFGWSISPKFSDMVLYAEFGTLFERYQIVKMTVKIEVLMGDSYNSVASQLPYLYSVNDQTDATPPPTLGTIQQYPGVKDNTLSCEKPLFFTCYPQPATLLYNGGVSAGYGSPSHFPQWLDSTSPNIPHYGMKFYMRNWIASAANLGNAIRIQPTLYFKVKEAH